MLTISVCQLVQLVVLVRNDSLGYYYIKNMSEFSMVIGDFVYSGISVL